MAARPAGTEFGGASGDFYNRHRVAILSLVLSLVGIVTGTMTGMAVLQGISVAEPVALGLGAVLAGACCAVQTRHLGLAAMAAAAPLPGLLWAAPLSAGASFGVVPFLAYACGFAVAALAAQTAMHRVLQDGQSEYPWRASAAAAGLAVMLGALWLWTTDLREAAIQAVVDVALSAGSALVLVPLGASVLHFDESFVARANRTLERRQRLLERLAIVAVPRWGLSFTGIALVFAVLGWFDGQALMRTGEVAFVLRAVSAVAVVVAAGFFARGWREGLATGVATATGCLVSLWASGKGPAEPFAIVGVLETTTVGMLLAFDGGRVALTFRARGETPAIARERMIEEAGAGQVFAVAGALLALVPAMIMRPAWTPALVALLAAGIGGIVWTPAATTALETIMPRHRSVEELYGMRKKSKA